MTPKLPAITAKELVRVAEPWASFFAVRAAATRFTCERASDQARVVIPMHGGDIKRKTLRAMINDMKISVEEFAKLL